MKKRFKAAGTDEALRPTLIPKKHENVASAFVSLNILIHQENVYQKWLQIFNKAKGEFGVFTGTKKELGKITGDVEKKCKKLQKNIAEIDKLVEKADETKWPKTLPKYVIEELVMPKGARDVLEKQEGFGAVIGMCFLRVQ